MSREEQAFLSTDYPSVHGNMAADFSTAGNFGNTQVVHQRVGKPRRRGLLLAHFAFKILGLAIYLLQRVWNTSYATTFVLVVLALSADFWLVKNLSGRLLAGLRWWNVVSDDGNGQMEWKFEAWSAEEREIAQSGQVNLFWAGILGQQLMWSLFLLSAAFNLHLGWLVIAFIANALNLANLYGYVRCRLQRKDVASAAKQASVVARIGEALGSLFRTSSDDYTRGTAYAFSSGAAP